MVDPLRRRDTGVSNIIETLRLPHRRLRRSDWGVNGGVGGCGGSYTSNYGGRDTFTAAMEAQTFRLGCQWRWRMLYWRHPHFDCRHRGGDFPTEVPVAASIDMEEATLRLPPLPLVSVHASMEVMEVAVTM